MSEAPVAPKLEIAHVLTMDVVGYSKLLIDEQTRVMAELTRLVREAARFQRAEADGKLLRLPTGDGMALVFFNDPEAPIECAMEISAALKSRPEIRVRMGIHSGPVNQVLDVNDRSNVAGAGIDMAQRVMDCGDAGHILLSKRVADDLTPYSRWNPHLRDLGECEVKHGRKVSLVNFFTDEIGNRELPTKCRPSRQDPKVRAIPFRARKSGITAAAVVLLLALVAVWWISARPRSLTPAAAPPPAQISKSIAVLPFENLSGEAENAYFADGIQEEILTRLSKIRDLKVISRTSTQRYKSAPGNLLEIAQQLGVAHIVEGSVQKSADAVRVNVQLINATKDAHLWAETYDRKLTDIFSVESEIAKTIAERLQANLTGAEQHAIAARPTENNEAHQDYLRGLFYWYKYPAPGFAKCREYFQQAIDLDPAYAPGHVGLGLYYGFSAANGLVPPDENWPKSEAAINKALELDPTSGDAHNALAAIKLYYYRDWPAAERLFRRGIELNPNLAEIRHHYAINLILFGRNEEALSEMQRAADLDPLALRNNFDRARVFLFLRQYERAVDQFHKTLELEPNFATAHEWLGYTYEQKGMENEAIAEWREALRLRNASDQADNLARTYASSGFQAALRSLGQQQLESAIERENRGEYVAPYEYVVAYTRSGGTEQAFAWLEKVVARHDRFALEFRITPLLYPLRCDPRFERLSNEVTRGAMRASQ
ncbi:MAG: tetratricopeptide repeat protein [Verrucomicrobiota bacterium]|nr:tetratricopeptide repeat protein [Verrucomicrobiota bacterium]